MWSAMINHILILHLSDLHFGTHNRFSDCDPKELAKRFNIAIEESKKDLLIDATINLVVITGDIVESGLPKEYNEAKEFLDALSGELKIDHKYFIFVPGNHDICWSLSQIAESEQNTYEFDKNELNERINKYKFALITNF